MAKREPFPHDDLVEEMARTFRDVQRTLAAQIQSAIAQGRLEFAAERRMQYAAVLATLDRLGAQTDQQARKVVSDAFKEGAGKTGAQISQQAGFAVSVPFSFTGVQQDAIEALQREVVDSLGISRRVVGRSVDDLYAKAGRRATVRALLGADGSPQIAARRLKADLLREPYVKRLIENGGTGFVDRAGKKWSLQTYSEMVVRTTTRKAVVEGQIAKMASLGVNLARVSTHASACPLCVPKQGRLVSLDGSTSDYNGEAVADLSSVGAPPYHPNCRHTLQPVVADIEALRQKMQGSPPSQPVTISKPKLPKPTPATTSVAKAADKPGEVPRFKSNAEAETWMNQNHASSVDFATADIEAVQDFCDGIHDVLAGTGNDRVLNAIRVTKTKVPTNLAEYEFDEMRYNASGFGGRGEIRIKPSEMRRPTVVSKKNDAQHASNFLLRQKATIEKLTGTTDPIKLDRLQEVEAMKRWSVSTRSPHPARANGRHEAAHALMYQTRGLERAWLKALEDIGPHDAAMISEYATANYSELWAEVVSAVHEGIEVPKALRKAYESVMKEFGYAI